MKRFVAGLAAGSLTACASVSTIPLSQDSFQLTSRTVMGCSMEGAQKVAFEQAAAETIRRGYDSFLIVDTDRQSMVDSASYSYGSAMYGHQHTQGLRVKMYKDGDPEAGAAISARQTLGPEWQDALQAEPTYSCA